MDEFESLHVGVHLEQSDRNPFVVGGRIGGRSPAGNRVGERGCPRAAGRRTPVRPRRLRPPHHAPSIARSRSPAPRSRSPAPESCSPAPERCSPAPERCPPVPKAVPSVGRRRSHLEIAAFEPGNPVGERGNGPSWAGTTPKKAQKRLREAGDHLGRPRDPAGRRGDPRYPTPGPLPPEPIFRASGLRARGSERRVKVRKRTVATSRLGHELRELALRLREHGFGHAPPKEDRSWGIPTRRRSRRRAGSRSRSCCLR